jgi:hypothetical protein
VQQVLTLSGSLSCAPPSVTGTTLQPTPQGFVPQGVSQTPISLNPPTKQSAVQTGLRHKSLSSPSGYQTISGLGTGDDVTTADTIYVKTDAPILLRVTQVNPAGGTTVSVLNLFGTYLQEFRSDGLATLLEAEGTADLEVLISGPA